MNALGTIIVANLAAAFVVFCGIKLFDMGSDFAVIIRRYGLFLGIILTLAAAFGFVLPDALDVIDGNQVFGITFTTLIVLLALGFCKDTICRRLLAKKRTRKENAVVAIGVIDIVGGIISGLALGVSFSLRTGTGLMVLCAWILFQIILWVARIQRYQKAHFTRRDNIIIFTISLCVMPIAAIIVALITRESYTHAGFFLAMLLAYLLYLGLFQIILVVKKLQKR